MLPTERNQVDAQEGEIQRRVGVDDGVQHLDLAPRVKVRQAHLPYLRAREAHADRAKVAMNVTASQVRVGRVESKIVHVT